MSTALVTGAAGFVGANLVRRLLADGHDVHALVRPGSDGWRLADVRSAIGWHEADLRDLDGVARAVDDAAAAWIFHLAAHGAYSWQADAQGIMSVNAVGTAVLLDCAAQRGFEAFVHAGSSSEYGFKDHAPGEDERIDPNSAYAVAKAAATHYLRYRAISSDLHAVTLRLYSVYGPWEEPRRLVPTLVRHGLRGELPPLVDPAIARDLVFVDDVCAAFVLAASDPSLPRGSVFNIGSGIETSLADIVELGRRLMNVGAEPQWGTMRARDWDTNVWIADAGRAERELGWRAHVSLPDGLAHMIEWLRDAEHAAAYERRVRD